MARLAVIGFGSRGDLFPLLGISRALRGRGHEVTVHEHEEYRDDVRDAGLRFASMGPGSACQAVFDVASRGAPALRLLARTAALRATPDAVRAVAGGPPVDAVLCHPFQYLGRHVADLLGVPLISVAGPDIADLFCPPAAAGDAERERARRVLRLLDRMTRPVLTSARDSLGLSPDAAVASSGALSPVAVMVTTSRLFHPVPTHWPEQFVESGYPDYDGAPTSAALPAAIEDFVRGGPGPLVVCSLGDSWSEELPPVCAHLAPVIRAMGGRTLYLSRRGRITTAGDAMLAHDVVPLRHVLPHAALVVHHAGRGTMLAAFRAGVPALMVPRWLDGFANARLAEALGAGRTVAPGVDAGELHDAVTTVLSGEQHGAAAAAGAVLRADRDPGDAAEECLRRALEAPPCAC